MTKKVLAAMAVTAALLVAAPAAANAENYTDGTPCKLDLSVVQSGDTARVICRPGTWASSEEVAWTATGEDGASIRLAATSTVTFTKQAESDGSDVLAVTLPADATGVYSIVGHGQASGHTCAVSLTVLPDDAAVPASDVGSQGLAATGSTIAAWAAWVGGGLLALGGLTVAIAAWVRRMRAS
ncbi:hypothetical protein P5G50_07560 [Leifsonia sp. F6_8S_P_1B]|uniref:Ig-like domain-containing protein n=1 Tax=Leifsonia williamsii TaxID=3035919 RepID=A0ABT8KA24_9MICO|nr:hypothetical protein [Leifsonia williamsii]MDN4614304.1 hypothetical protein [Leifsonia williamsii]